MASSRPRRSLTVWGITFLSGIVLTNEGERYFTATQSSSTENNERKKWKNLPVRFVFLQTLTLFLDSCFIVFSSTESNCRRLPQLITMTFKWMKAFHAPEHFGLCCCSFSITWLYIHTSRSSWILALTQYFDRLSLMPTVIYSSNSSPPQRYVSYTSQYIWFTIYPRISDTIGTTSASRTKSVTVRCEHWRQFIA